MVTHVFRFVGESLVVDQVYQSCDGLLVEWDDREELVILKDIIGVNLELL